MSDIKISIIVPVYQAEKYLSECLESLLHQNISEYEILCIDDGSTDRSAEIIHKFQRKSDKIVYFYQTNQGVSAARNQGIELARGKYIMFVDSDDAIKKNCLRYLYQKAEQKASDILVFGGKPDTPLKAPEWMRMALYTRCIDYEECIPEILYNEAGVQPFVWNKLFRKECIKNVRFPWNINIAEDMTFLFVLLPTIHKISFVRKRIYLYRISNAASAMHRTSDAKIKYMENHVRAAETIAASWKKYGLFEKDTEQFAEWLTSFLREPYKELLENEANVFLERIQNLFALVHSDNRLLLPEPRGGDSFPISRICRIIRRDIGKYGIVGGVENILYKILYGER